jgi:hypothetical protein
MNLSVRVSHGMATDSDVSTNIAFIAVHDAQMREGWKAVAGTRKVGVVFWQRFVVQSIEDGTPLIFFEGMRLSGQMRFEVFSTEGDTTAGIGANGDLILIVVLNQWSTKR